MSFKTPNPPSPRKIVPPSRHPLISEAFDVWERQRDEFRFQEPRLRATKAELRPQTAVRLLKVATCSHPVKVTIASLARTEIWSVNQSMQQATPKTHPDARTVLRRLLVQNTLVRAWMKTSLYRTTRSTRWIAELHATGMYRTMQWKMETELVHLIRGVGLLGKRLFPLQRMPIVRLVSASMLVVCAMRTALHGGRALEP